MISSTTAEEQSADPEAASHSLDWRKPMCNAGKLTLGRSVQAVCSLAYLAFATRTLGLEDFGKLVLIHSLCLAATQMARFESWQTIVRFGAPAWRSGHPLGLRRVLNFGLMLDLAGMMFGVLAYAAVLYPLGAWMGLSVETRNFALPYGLVLIVVLNISGSATGLLHLLDRFGSLAKASTLEPVIRLIGAIVLFFLGGGLKAFLILWLIALTASHVATVLAAFTHLARCGALWRFRFEKDAWIRPQPGMWRYAFGTFWVGTMNVARDYLPTLAAGVVAGAAGAGLLKIAKQFSDVLTSITTKLLVPALFSEFAHLKENEQRALLARLNVLAVCLFLLVFLCLAVFGKSLILLIAGPEFVTAYPSMLWFAFAGVLGATSFGFETLLAAVGAIRQLVWANSISLVLYFAVMAALLHPMGIAGVGMAAVAHAAIRSALLWWSASRRDPGHRE